MISKGIISIVYNEKNEENESEEWGSLSQAEKLDLATDFMSSNEYSFTISLTDEEIKGIRKPCFWKIRYYVLKAYRKLKLKLRCFFLGIRNELRWRKRIRKAGLTKEKNKQRKWIKKILKYKDEKRIINEIINEGYEQDWENIGESKTTLGDVLNGLYIYHEYQNWGIEILSGIERYKEYEFLRLVTPERSFNFIKTFILTTEYYVWYFNESTVGSKDPFDFLLVKVEGGFRYYDEETDKWVSDVLYDDYCSNFTEDWRNKSPRVVRITEEEMDEFINIVKEDWAYIEE